uniref:Uncharacterized protein n=1 Tax=Ciona savignyi TaxID=51511 RepID=H2YWI6_CIOSA
MEGCDVSGFRHSAGRTDHERKYSYHQRIQGEKRSRIIQPSRLSDGPKPQIPKVMQRNNQLYIRGIRDKTRQSRAAIQSQLC